MQEEYKEALCNSTTVYVGNLAFSTTDEQIYEVSTHCDPSSTRCHAVKHHSPTIHTNTSMAWHSTQHHAAHLVHASQLPALRASVHQCRTACLKTSRVRLRPCSMLRLQPARCTLAAGVLSCGHPEEHPHGPGQAQQVALRLLLRGVLHTQGGSGSMRCGASIRPAGCWCSPAACMHAWALAGLTLCRGLNCRHRCCSQGTGTLPRYACSKPRLGCAGAWYAGTHDMQQRDTYDTQGRMPHAIALAPMAARCHTHCQPRTDVLVLTR
jgi:hypothetical protein